jgi:hypothetical protein
LIQALAAAVRGRYNGVAADISELCNFPQGRQELFRWGDSTSDYEAAKWFQTSFGCQALGEVIEMAIEEDFVDFIVVLSERHFFRKMKTHSTSKQLTHDTSISEVNDNVLHTVAAKGSLRMMQKFRRAARRHPSAVEPGAVKQRRQDSASDRSGATKASHSTAACRNCRPRTADFVAVRYGHATWMRFASASP